MPTDFVQYGEVGVELLGTLRDRNTDEPIDIASAIVKECILTDPDANVSVRPASLQNNGTDGRIKYTSEVDVLDVLGTWGYQFRVRLLDGQERWTHVREFVVLANLDAPAIVGAPMMSMIPLPPTIPATEEEYYAMWNYVKVKVGPNRVVSNFDSFGNWLDIYHQTAIAAFTNGEKLNLMVSSSEIIGQDLEQFLANVDAVLALYGYTAATFGDKIWSFCTGIEINEILTTDAGEKRPILLAAFDRIRATNPKIRVYVSINLGQAIDEGNLQTCVENAALLGDAIGISDYIGPRLSPYLHDLQHIVTARYSPIRTYAGTKEIIVAECGSRSDGPLADEVQLVAILGNLSSGTYTLEFVDYADAPQATGNIAYDANIAAVQSAVDAVMGAGNVVVGGTAQYAMTLTYAGPLYAALPQETVEVNTAGLVGVTGANASKVVIGGRAGLASATDSALHGEAVEAEFLNRIHAIHVGLAPCPLVTWTIPFDSDGWYGTQFMKSGLSKGTVASPIAKIVDATWTERKV